MTSQRTITPVPTDRDTAPCYRPDSPAPTFRPEILLCDPDPVRAGRLKSSLAGCGRVVYHARLEAARLACQVGSPSLILLPFGGAADAAETLDFLRAFAR